jgi:predicted nucleotidyltransferase
MITLNQIQTFVNEIAEGYLPDKVYLFGSYANDTATDDSDIDLFIIKSTNFKKTERNIQVRNAIKTYPYVGLDIIVYTPEELQSGMQDVVNIGKEAIKNGKLLYERV